MSFRWSLLALLLVPLALVGCAARDLPDIAPEDNETRLGDRCDIDLKTWLDLPRAELAKVAADRHAAVKGHLDRLRNDPTSVKLLPTFRVPVHPVAFRNATFDPVLGVTVPPYVKADRPAVARQLARFGDHEAADKLGGAAGVPKLARNYPVEWAQAVGWALTEAQFRLASGDEDGATTLVHLHRQLVELLDDPARQSELGAALLPRGRNALLLAARAWRDPKVHRTALADDVEKALADWGDPVPARLPRLGRDELALVWGRPVNGPVVTAVEAEKDRVLDLLALPVPADGVQAVGAFLDEAGRLAEVQLAFRSGLDSLYPTPADLAVLAEERGLVAVKEEKTAGLHRQAFLGTALSADVVRTNRSPAIGALVRLTAGKEEVAAVPGPRDRRSFGVAHLDRTFEACRVAIDPRLAGASLTVVDPQALARLSAGLPTPTAAQIDRDGELVGAVRLTWTVDPGTAQIAAMIAGLWSAYGRPDVAEHESALGLRWQDERTQVELRLPFDEKGPVLVAQDARPKEKQAERLAEARQRDQKERRERIAAGKADVRLAAGPGAVNGVSLAGLKVGQPRAEAEAALPSGRSYRRHDLSDGVSVLINTVPEKRPYWARQVLVRFADEKVSEVRVRYLEGLAEAKKGEALREQLDADPKAGAGQVLPGPWAGLWADVSSAGGELVRWQDDQTIRTYQRDAGGSEVTWRARGEKDEAAAPWLFVTAGPGGLGVGATRKALEAAWGKPATKSDTADVFRMTEKSGYEMALVWFDGDRAARVLAVHRGRLSGEQPEQVSKALLQAWGRDVDGLGVVRRETGRRGDVLGALYWHDDVVRVRTFVQAEDGGPRQLTEWRAWPVGK